MMGVSTSPIMCIVQCAAKKTFQCQSSRLESQGKSGAERMAAEAFAEMSPPLAVARLRFRTARGGPFMQAGASIRECSAPCVPSFFALPFVFSFLNFIFPLDKIVKLFYNVIALKKEVFFMKPVILSVRPVSGVSKKSGKEFMGTYYDVLYKNRYGRFAITCTFVGAMVDPHFVPGDLVGQNGFTGELEKVGHSDVLMEVLDTLN